LYRQKLKFSKESGFTLIEVVTQLAILMIIAAVIPVILILSKDLQDMKNSRDDLEWEVVINELLHMTIEAEAVKVQESTGARLVFYTHPDNPNVTYSVRISERILRRYKNGGNELMSNAFANMQFRLEGNKLIVSSTYYNGKKKERHIVALQKQ